MERKKTIVINLDSRFGRMIRFPSRIWKKIRGDKVAVAGSILAVLIFLLAVFCYLIIPDNTTYANRSSMPISNQPPGFEITMLRVVENKPSVPQGFFSRLIHGTRPTDILVPLSRSYYEGTDIVVKEFSASGDSTFESRYNIADVVYPLNIHKEIVERNRGLFFETADGTAVEESINDIQGFIEGQYLLKKKFVLGTDRFGRDVLSRVIASTRASLFAAFMATLIALLSGLVLGLLTGISLRKDKSLMNWLLKSVASIPAFLLIAGIMFMIGRGFWNVCIVTGLVMSAEIARVIAGIVFAGREKKFIDGISALGISKRQILRRHILPEIKRPFIAAAAVVFCGAILVESGLSFLEIGMPDYFPSWGSMIRENFGYIIVPGSSYLTLLPGIALLLVSMLFVILVNRFHHHIGVKYYWMSV